MESNRYAINWRTIIQNIDIIKAKEINLYPKKWRKNLKKVLLVFPNRYYIGMSNLGFHTIFKKINEIDDVICERGFYPYPVSFETKTPFNEFELIIFSISFEIDFLNVIDMLIKSGIELFKKKRKKPFLTAGGIAITLNPFILKEIFDVQLIGEGEELIIEFVKNFFTDKEKIYSIEGVFSENKEIKRRIYTGNYIAHSTILTENTEFSNYFLIEISRGCPYSCYFCAATYNYRPYREKDYNEILKLFENFNGKIKKVGLIGSSVLSHKKFFDICNYLIEKNIDFSVSSLRLDKINDEVLRLLKLGKNSSFTVAIEAGSERLRKLINKKLSDEKIFYAIDLFIKHKILNLKFYFMIGLPGEKWDDVEKIVEIIEKIKKEYLKNKKYLKHLGAFTISVNPFIPKRNTPFFKYPIDKFDILTTKISFLKKRLKKIPNVKVQVEDITKSYIQCLLSKDDGKFLPFLIEKVKKRISDKKFVFSFIDKIEKM